MSKDANVIFYDQVKYLFIFQGTWLKKIVFIRSSLVAFTNLAWWCHPCLKQPLTLYNVKD